MAIIWIEKVHGRSISNEDVTITKTKSKDGRRKWYLALKNGYGKKIDKKGNGSIMVGLDGTKMYFVSSPNGYKLMDQKCGHRISISEAAITENLPGFVMPIGDFNMYFDNEQKKYYIDLEQKIIFE